MSRPFLRSISASPFLSALVLLLAGCRPAVLLEVERDSTAPLQVYFCSQQVCDPAERTLVSPFETKAEELKASVGVDFDGSGERTMGMMWLSPERFCRNWQVAYTGGSVDISAKVSCAGVTLTCEGATCTDLGACPECVGCDGCQ